MPRRAHRCWSSENQANAPAQRPNVSPRCHLPFEECNFNEAGVAAWRTHTKRPRVFKTLSTASTFCLATKPAPTPEGAWLAQRCESKAHALARSRPTNKDCKDACKHLLDQPAYSWPQSTMQLRSEGEEDNNDDDGVVSEKVVFRVTSSQGEKWRTPPWSRVQKCLRETHIRSSLRM